MKNSKSVLIRAAAMVCFFGFFAAHAQNLNLSVKIDPVKKEVVTYVNLTEIPTGVDIVWQQKIPKDAVCLSSFFQIRQNDDGSKMVTTTFSRNLLLSSKMSFSFSCTVDAIGDWIRWGETTLTYTAKKSKEQVVKFPAQVFIVAECLMDSVTPIAAQKPQPANDLGEKAKLANAAAEVKQEVVKVEENPYIHQSTDQIIVLQVPEKVVMMQEAEQVIVKQELEQIVVKQEPERVIVKQEPEQVVVKQEPERVIVKQEPEQVIVKQEPEQVVVKQEPEQVIVKQEPEQVIVKQEPERVVVKQEPEQSVVKQEPAKPVQQAPVNQATAKPQSGYYIQVASLSKSNLAGIKSDIHVLKGDNVIEVTRDKFFIYYVGPFPTEKDASDKLKQHYIKYVPTAFVKKL